MKILKFSLIALFIVSSFAACKKDKKEPAVVVPPIQGKWIGLAISNATPPQTTTLYFSINSDGQFQTLNSAGTPVFTGTWLLAGNVFTAKYADPQSNTYYYKGTFDSTQKTLTGTYGTEVTATNLGTWSMTKVQ